MNNHIISLLKNINSIYDNLYQCHISWRAFDKRQENQRLQQITGSEIWINDPDYIISFFVYADNISIYLVDKLSKRSSNDNLRYADDLIKIKNITDEELVLILHDIIEQLQTRFYAH